MLNYRFSDLFVEALNLRRKAADCAAVVETGLVDLPDTAYSLVLYNMRLAEPTS